MKDPVEARADESDDLYDVASWEPRNALDRLAVKTHGGAVKAGRAFVVALGVFVLLLILAGGAGAIIIDNPFVLALVVLSVVPAGLIALYVYLTDITTNEPPSLLAVTFVLSILFAGFAAIVNSRFGFLQSFGLLGAILFYYVIVGPGEEIVKLLSVRLVAYRDDRFDAVIDGAVYGAVAGLGFATIENAIYITQNLGTTATVLASSGSASGSGIGLAQQLLEAIDEGGGITAVRSLAGPGHVIYSTFAGYYLGLAKFNRENAGPIVVKGLLVAAFIHASYNTLVGIVPPIVSFFYPGVPMLAIFVGFVVVYDGALLYVLYRKLQQYRRTYTRVHDGPDEATAHDSELTEFDPETRS